MKLESDGEGELWNESLIVWCPEISLLRSQCMGPVLSVTCGSHLDCSVGWLVSRYDHRYSTHHEISMAQVWSKVVNSGRLISQQEKFSMVKN